MVEGKEVGKMDNNRRFLSYGLYAMLVAALIFGVPWIATAAEASDASACAEYQNDLLASEPTGWGVWSRSGGTSGADAWTSIFSPGMPTTIVGKVYNRYELVTDDGTVFHVTRDARGKMLGEHMGRTVEVKGNVVESGGKNIITVGRIIDLG